MERKTGFEPVTFSLARRCSTTEPLPPGGAGPLTILAKPTPAGTSVLVQLMRSTRRLLQRSTANFRLLRKRAHISASSGLGQITLYCSRWSASSFAVADAVPQLLHRLERAAASNSSHVVRALASPLKMYETTLVSDHSDDSSRPTSRPRGCSSTSRLAGSDHVLRPRLARQGPLARMAPRAASWSTRRGVEPPGPRTSTKLRRQPRMASSSASKRSRA